MASSRLLDRYADGRPAIIITDLEPDDLIALYALFTHWISTEPVTIIISAWTTQQGRADFLNAFLNRYFERLNFQLYLGLCTDKEYAYPTVPTTNTYPSWETAHMHPRAFYLQLAPVQELYQLYNRGHHFGTSTLAIYGSYNIRSVLNKDDQLAISHEAMFSQFEQMCFYESTPAAIPTNIHDLTFVPEIDRVITWWNGVIYEYCSVHREQPRSRAIAESIEADPKQFVCADAGLIATLLMDPMDIPHLVTGRLDLPKRSGRSGYRMYTAIRNVEASTDALFLTLVSKDVQVLSDHGRRILALLSNLSA